VKINHFRSNSGLSPGHLAHLAPRQVNVPPDGAEGSSDAFVPAKQVRNIWASACAALCKMNSDSCFSPNVDESNILEMKAKRWRKNNLHVRFLRFWLCAREKKYEFNFWATFDDLSTFGVSLYRECRQTWIALMDL
jgi:hypothetical protein